MIESPNPFLNVAAHLMQSGGVPLKEKTAHPVQSLENGLDRSWNIQRIQPTLPWLDNQYLRTSNQNIREVLNLACFAFIRGTSLVMTKYKAKLRQPGVCDDPTEAHVCVMCGIGQYALDL